MKHYHVWLARESSSTGTVKSLQKVGRPYGKRGQATKAIKALLRERGGILWTHVLECKDPNCPHDDAQF